VRYPLALLVVLGALFALLAIAPLDRETWALESSLLVVAVAGLWATRRVLPLSHASYTLVFVFLALHALGAHYTYSLVPYDRWFESATGRTLSELAGWRRNHYDRLVHFCFGLLLAYPMRELFQRVVRARGFWSYLLPFQMTMSWSALYELLEWAAALVFGGDLGIAYLGTQGDEWDAQKDMALAGSGAVLSLLLTALFHRARGRDLQLERIERLWP
jgi:putative membrane protein